MFWRRKRNQLKALALMATMSEEEKIQTRCMTVFWLALKDPVHMMTATQDSATEHADFFTRIGERLGIEVSQLPLEGTGSARLAAYRAKVVVGPISEFIMDHDRGLHPEDAIAMVEGKPPAAARLMLSRYMDVRLS